MTPARHLVLVGPMGAGKTTVGALLSAATGLPLVDSDRVLAAESEVAADIAQEHGVGALHERECEQLLAALATPRPSIVAAAASTVEVPACRAALDSHVVVWLRPSPEAVAGRIGEGTHRRSLGPDPLKALRTIAARRDPLYADLADVVVDVDAVSPAEASRIVHDAYEAATRSGFGHDRRG